MKGSLFPLGQPLRELEDRPRVGFLPRLQPCLLLCHSWCPGLPASYPWPAPSLGPSGATGTQQRCPPPSPPCPSLLWSGTMMLQCWGLGSALHAREPCWAGCLGARRACGESRYFVLGRGNMPDFTSQGSGLRGPHPEPCRLGERGPEKGTGWP